MVHNATVVLHVSVVLFAVPVALQDCMSYNDSRGDPVLCREWTPFCCGTCDKIYCCNNPEEKLTSGCFSSETVKYSSDSLSQMEHHPTIIVPIVFFTFTIIMFTIFCCCHRKSFRNVPSRVWMPTGPSQAQLYVLGPSPSYHEAGGNPVLFSQAAYDGAQVMYSVQPQLPTDYTSPPPAYNPAYTDSPKTSY